MLLVAGTDFVTAMSTEGEDQSRCSVVFFAFQDTETVVRPIDETIPFDAYLPLDRLKARVNGASRNDTLCELYRHTGVHQNRLHELPILSRENIESGASLSDALSKVGGALLTGFNPGPVIRPACGVSRQFFNQPMEYKGLFNKTRPSNMNVTGFNPLGYEIIGASNPRFSTSPMPVPIEFFKTMMPHTQNLPDDAIVQGFQSITIDAFEYLSNMARYVLTKLGQELWNDENILLNIHQHMGTVDNFSRIRYTHYPPVPGKCFADGEVRAGKHTDYGTLTLSIQENPGLEIWNRANNEWITVPMIEGAILVLAADNLETLTGCKIASTPHQVVFKHTQPIRSLKSSNLLKTIEREVFLPNDYATSNKAESVELFASS